jgi:formylglycine-generating enzyme required for sulfatase activity/serine/threonine protein kinase
LQADAAHRKPPFVPNHEMVRVIGRGSYGEIWLARSLTGAWRAVKIVDRRTFESDKAFLREFEGMSKFEPISRGDAGFVDILHVGRDDSGGFFYYVMELADDHLARAPVDPEHYLPKTLKSELSRRSRLLADECVIIGLSLTKALSALHRQGLVHRDIKPANIIFVGGVPKIADIGLVADSGQTSYVGTEGYVPLEGPGTPQADLYSLGKVLYEIAMGKDRMDFPAVNSSLGELPDKAALLKLNDVFLRACANDPASRYTDAEAMHEDLLRLRDGRRLVDHRKRRFLLPCGVSALLILAGGLYHLENRRSAHGAAYFETEPPGAMIVLGDRMVRSPADFSDLQTGRHSARVMLPGYEPVDVRFDVKANTTTRPSKINLAHALGSAEINSNPPGATFELRQGAAVIKKGKCPQTLTGVPTGQYDLVMNLGERQETDTLEIKHGELTTKNMEFASGAVIVDSTPAGAEIWLDGKRAGIAPMELSMAEGGHEIVGHYGSWPVLTQEVKATHSQKLAVAFEFVGGSAKIASAPGGAIVIADGQEIGRTPMLKEDLDPGEVRYTLRLPGFKDIEVKGLIQPGEQTFMEARFVNRAGPVRGEPWENDLGMKFAPVRGLLVSIWPVRVQDYEAFCQATSRARSIPDFSQTPTHPVVKVSWEDATDFCEWLTAKELGAGRIEEGQRYRLPTDLEWSMAAGIPDEGRATPEERDGKGRDFPWGKQWPPPPGAGNFADSAIKKAGKATIPGYHDGFPQTSPVGSFPPNRFGLFDMSGNVWQWCADPYKGGATGAHDWGVLRGGSWGTASPAELRSSYRNVIERSERDVLYGFRCVLDPGPGP